MRLLGTVGAAVLSLMLAAVPLAYSQDQKPPDETKPEAKPAHEARPIPPAKQGADQRPERNDRAQDEKPQQQKAAQDDRRQLDEQKRMQDEQKKAQENQSQQNEEKQSKEAQKQQEKQRKDQEKQARENRPNDDRDNRTGDHRAQPAQAGNARGGGHIPDDKFRASFGREHHFHVSHPTVVAGGRPQFVYSGYTFVLVDAWPAEWSYDDDCYVDYIDGEYYLYDLRHPGVQIAIMVVM